MVGLIWQKQLALLLDHGLSLTGKPSGQLSLNEEMSCKELTSELGHIVQTLFDAGFIPGWRDELYPLVDKYQASPAALVERAAMPLFGGCGYGVHVNGLTKKNGHPHLWIARRALDKPTDPGKLDQIAAGGIPYGIDVFSNMQKECGEEAAIGHELSANATAVSMSSYFYQVSNGIRADVLFNYDLWLPSDFIPENTDGEVSEFMCLPIQEVMDMIQSGDEFKFNASIVLIDLFIRHGYLTPKHSDYEEICGLLNPRQAVLSNVFNTFNTL